MIPNNLNMLNIGSDNSQADNRSNPHASHEEDTLHRQMYVDIVTYMSQLNMSFHSYKHSSAAITASTLLVLNLAVEMP